MSPSTLTIDGRAVAFEPGQTVLQAAEAAGLEIPNLCAYPTIKPFGRCRLCIVAIEGVRGYPSACTTPCTPGMVVVTESDELLALRRDALALVLTEHPTGCLLCGHQDDCIDHHGCHSRRSGAVTGCRFCPKDQQCELQDMVQRLGVETIDYPVRYKGLPIDHRDPFFDRDYNLCILCARCVRVCDERRGAQTISLLFRGPHAQVGTAYDRTLFDSGCQFCGECVDVCPTGSLAERVNKWVGVPDRRTATTCGFCVLGCEVELRSLDNQIVGARPLGDALCSVGRFAPVETAVAEGRLLEPHVRRRGRLVPADWDEALDAAAAGLKGAGATALFASGDLLDEDLDAIAALGNTMGSPAASDAAWHGPSGGVADVATARRILVIGAQLRYRRGRRLAERPRALGDQGPPPAAGRRGQRRRRGGRGVERARSGDHHLGSESRPERSAGPGRGAARRQPAPARAGGQPARRAPARPRRLGRSRHAGAPGVRPAAGGELGRGTIQGGPHALGRCCPGRGRRAPAGDDLR